MAFNYAMKYRTYEAALNKVKELFSDGDTENGIYYLDKAISLSKELSLNAEVIEFKQRFEKENKKLITIKKNFLENGTNPFVKREKIENTNSNQQANSKKENTKTENFFKSEAPNITLDDVAGLEEVKKEIRLNVLLPLNNPEFYYKYKDEVNCQILMYGPPGCGKSFVAEAIAGELKCAYAIVNVFDILDKYVGEAPKKIKELFKEAEQYDNCLIFFDELDALFASRDSQDSDHTKDVLTAVLTCMSGFNSNKNKKNVKVIIGATNRPWALDSAVIRGKRFDTHLYVTLPDYEARLFLVKKEFKNHMNLLENTDITLEELVNRFEGYSGADIGSMISKMKTLALEEALNYQAKGIDKDVPISLKFVDQVFKNYRNSVTEESLLKFEAFRKGEF